MIAIDDRADEVPDSPTPVTAAVTTSWSEDEEELEEAEIIEDDLFFPDDDQEPLPLESTTVPASSRDPLSTVTLAEIYLAQGLYDQALRIFWDLSDADPDNEQLQQRIIEIEMLLAEEAFPPSGTETVVPGGAELLPEIGSSLFPLVEPASHSLHEQIVLTLELWLASIERRRTCR